MHEKADFSLQKSAFVFLFSDTQCGGGIKSTYFNHRLIVETIPSYP
jgi:hypothetical protein